MNELVFLKNEQPVTTSLIVAEGTDNDHKSVIRLINEYKADFEEDWGAVRFSDLKSTNPLGGRPTRVAILNEPQATFLITLLRNNEIVVRFKKKLVAQFYQMREILLNRQNTQWQELRTASKVGYKELSAAVRELYEWAVANGCKAPEKVFYMNFAKAMNKTLGINPKSRDKLAAWKLFEIDKLQFMAKTIIKGHIARGDDYHVPYQKCKSAFDSYAQLSFINQRLLES